MHKHVVYWFLASLLVRKSASADSPGPHQNIFRAYPPSCLADPLPTEPTGPTWVFPIELPLDSNIAPNGFESDQVTFWRVPCEAGASALLGRIDRPAVVYADVPTMPAIRVIESNGTIPLRIASEPNTFRSRIVAGSSFIYGYPADENSSTPPAFVVFVLENEPTDLGRVTDFSAALGLQVDPAEPCGFSACPPPPHVQHSGLRPVAIPGCLTVAFDFRLCRRQLVRPGTLWRRHTDGSGRI